MLIGWSSSFCAIHSTPRRDVALVLLHQVQERQRALRF
jgi:hypothetical protein